MLLMPIQNKSHLVDTRSRSAEQSKSHAVDLEQKKPCC